MSYSHLCLLLMLIPDLTGADVTLHFVGDVSFDTAVHYYHKHGHCSYNNSFVNVAALLKQSDLVIGNLENPFVRYDLRKDALVGPFTTLLSAEPDSVEALTFAGFNLMSLANNHLDDYKTKPINHTVELLLEQGILPFGYNLGTLCNEEPQTPVTAEVYGIKIGFLGYCSTYRSELDSEGHIFFHCIEKRRGLDVGPAIYTDEVATRDVNNLKAKVDVIVVYMHWGTMFFPTPSARQQCQAAHLQSLGVHIVIGSHPHVLQGHTLKEDTLVAYSLGNFLFGPKGRNLPFYYNGNPPMEVVREFENYMSTEGMSDNSLESRILRVEINKKGVVRASYLPLRILQDPKTKCIQPTPAMDVKWIAICEDGDQACADIATLHFVGDVCFDSAVKYYHKHGSCSYNNTFENVAAVLKRSDLVIGNLENPFVREDLRKDALIGFNTLLSADPDSVEALKFAGFNLMSLANNHLDDYKTKPINHTVELLLEQGILPFGYDIGSLGNEEPQIPVTAELYGIKIGFLGYCSTYRPERDSEGRIFFHCVEKRRSLDAGPAVYTDEAATRDVNNLKSKVDIIVVLMHWGTMLNGTPSQRQQRQAEHLKSLGVHVVIGSHPHVLGGHTFDGNRLVAYSLGNFLFAPKEKNAWFYYNRSPPMTCVRKFENYMATDGKNDETLQSRILRVELNKKGVVRASYLPLRIVQNPKTKCLQPTPVLDAKWISVCEHGDKDCLNST